MPPLAPTLDLEAADLNLAIVASDGLAVTLTFNVSLAGYGVEAWIVERKSREPVQQITALLAQDDPGIITLSVTGALTEPLEDRSLDWWLRLTPGGGQPRTALAGHFHAKEL